MPRAQKSSKRKFKKQIEHFSGTAVRVCVCVCVCVCARHRERKRERETVRPSGLGVGQELKPFGFWDPEFGRGR